MTWVALGSAILGAGASTSKPATPSMSSANPVVSSIFDGSGWSMNFAGTQTATSSPRDTASPVVSGAPQSAQASGGSAIDGNMLMLAGGLILLVMLWR